MIRDLDTANDPALVVDADSVSGGRSVDVDRHSAVCAGDCDHQVRALDDVLVAR